MGELNSRLAMIVDRNSGILNENKHLKETMDMEKKKYADEVTNFRNIFCSQRHQNLLFWISVTNYHFS